MSIGQFPKTLEIRNTSGGCIWQIYHVQSQEEIDRLTATSRGNGFYSQTVVPYRAGEPETFPGWRNEVEWTDTICPLCQQKPCTCLDSGQ